MSDELGEDDRHALALAMAVEAELTVGRGGMSEEAVAEWLLLAVIDKEHPGLDDDRRAAIARAAARYAVVRQVQAQAVWPEETDCDRLADAFAALELSGIVTSAGETCCSTCAHEELTEQALERDDAYGYAFYHSQDLNGVTPGESSGLLIGFGHTSGEVDDVRLVGHQVAAALRSAGLEVGWDGNPENRLQIDLVWKRRWLESATESLIEPEICELFEVIDDRQVSRERARIALGFSSAILEIEERATSGDSNAMAEMGSVCGFVGDTDAARMWFERGASLGSPAAMFRLAGLAQRTGDVEAESMWLHKAAAVGEPQAMFLLACTAEESGDIAGASSLLTRAADGGSAQALSRLGRLCDESEDYEAAITWYEKAVAAGDGAARDALERATIRQRAVLGDTEAMVAAAAEAKSDTRILKALLTRISEKPVYSIQDTFALAKRSDAGDIRWCLHFIESNMRIVVSIAMHHRGQGVPFLELIQGGSFGLVRALNAWLALPERAEPFDEYCAWWIESAVELVLESDRNGQRTQFPDDAGKVFEVLDTAAAHNAVALSSATSSPKSCAIAFEAITRESSIFRLLADLPAEREAGITKACDWLTRAADLGDEDAVKALADLGDMSAMSHLGLLAYKADDLVLAESWWQKAADLGDTNAMFNLGVLAYRAGDMVLVESWYQKAADLGHPDAMYHLGNLAHDAGDLVLAGSWRQKAADLGNVSGMVDLGRLAEKASDLALAESWWQKAADLGSSDGMFGLGDLAFHAGDVALAESWYRKAADLGNSEGMWGLGNLAFRVGDLALAESWWRKAADFGNAYGMASLGMLADNAGDRVLAKAWYQKAADLGNEYAVSALAELGET
jgi:TPR repeat protein